MRKLIALFVLVVSLAQCSAQNGKPAEASQQLPLKTLAWNLREVIRMQLPLTITEEKNGRPTGKSYSFDFASGDSLHWEIPEKYHDPETMEIYGGGKYIIPFESLDPASISLETAPESGHLSIVIKAKKGAHFTFHPYSNEPDGAVSAIRLGWWEPVQERTLGRALALFRQLAGSL